MVGGWDKTAHITSGVQAAAQLSSTKHIKDNENFVLAMPTLRPSKLRSQLGKILIAACEQEYYLKPP